MNEDILVQKILDRRTKLSKELEIYRSLKESPDAFREIELEGAINEYTNLIKEIRTVYEFNQRNKKGGTK